MNNETSVTQSIDDLFQLPADQKKKVIILAMRCLVVRTTKIKKNKENYYFTILGDVKVIVFLTKKNTLTRVFKIISLRFQ